MNIMNRRTFFITPMHVVNNTTQRVRLNDLTSKKTVTFYPAFDTKVVIKVYEIHDDKVDLEIRTEKILPEIDEYSA